LPLHKAAGAATARGEAVAMVGRVLVQVMAVPVTMGRVAMVSVAGAVPGRGELRERGVGKREGECQQRPRKCVK